MFTPQKSFKSCLPPKPSTPKTSQKPNFSFENSQNIPITYNYSPRNSTPIKQKLLNPYFKTPLRSNNSSPSNRLSVEVLPSNVTEENKKFHEHILKIEAEKEKFRIEIEKLALANSELEHKVQDSAGKLKKKDEKIRFLALLLKETEVQFKTVLENTSKDLEKIIQDQALKIKELNETLKCQQKDLRSKWEKEKNELAAQINLLEKMNVERLRSQAENFNDKINELSFNLEQLETSKIKKESDLEFYLTKNGDDESFGLICGLGLKVKNDIAHLRGIVQSVVNGEEVSLMTILMAPDMESSDQVGISELPKVLQHCILSLHIIKTCISDLYAEKYGEVCHLQ